MSRPDKLKVRKSNKMFFREGRMLSLEHMDLVIVHLNNVDIFSMWAT